MIPHFSTIPPQLKTEINRLHINKAILFESFNKFPPNQTKVIIIGPLGTIRSKYTIRASEGGNIDNWEKQGVILTSPRLPLINNDLNTYWKQVLTDYIKWIDNNVRYKVYMVWGEEAGQFIPSIGKDNLVLTAPAPSSPLFAQLDMFNEANDYLGRKNRGEIRW